MEASPKPTEVERDFRVVEGEHYPKVDYRIFYVPGILPPPVREAPELGVSIDLVVQNQKRGVMYRLETEDVLMWLDCVRENAKILVFNGDLDTPRATLSRQNFERAMNDPRIQDVLTAQEHAEDAEGRFAAFLKYLANEYEGRVSPHIPVGAEDG